MAHQSQQKCLLEMMKVAIVVCRGTSVYRKKERKARRMWQQEEKTVTTVEGAHAARVYESMIPSLQEAT